MLRLISVWFLTCSLKVLVVVEPKRILQILKNPLYFIFTNGLLYGVQFAVRTIQIIQVCKCKGADFLMLRSRQSFFVIVL